MRASVSSEEIASARISCSDRFLKFLATPFSYRHGRRMGILFLRHRRSRRSSRRRGNTDGCPGGEGVGWVDDYCIGFGDAAQDFGLYSEVAPYFDVTKLHNALGVHDANLHTFTAKYECVIR